MGLFDKLLNKNKLNEPVMYKEKSDYGQREKLEKMLAQKQYAEYKNQIQEDIIRIKSGDYGENQVKYYLMHSYMPMYILHDVYLEYDKNNKAQIDFLVITKKMIFVIECKNYSYSSCIKIDKDSQFIITQKDGTKKSMKNPLEQNRIHTEVTGRLFPELKKICFPLVVFTNEDSILDYSNAPDKIRNHIVRADNLVNHISMLNKNCRSSELTDDKMKKYADCFMSRNTKNPVDYTAKYTEKSAVRTPVPKKVPDTDTQKQNIRCLCPNCKKPVPKGYFFCSCGMQFSVYGTKLSDEQINSLINGRTIQCDTKFGVKTVYPQTETREYQGKTFIQWKALNK